MSFKIDIVKEYQFRDLQYMALSKMHKMQLGVMFHDSKGGRYTYDDWNEFRKVDKQVQTIIANEPPKK